MLLLSLAVHLAVHLLPYLIICLNITSGSVGYVPPYRRVVELVENWATTDRQGATMAASLLATPVAIGKF